MAKTKIKKRLFLLPLIGGAVLFGSVKGSNACVLDSDISSVPIRQQVSTFRAMTARMEKESLGGFNLYKLSDFMKYAQNPNDSKHIDRYFSNLEKLQGYNSNTGGFYGEYVIITKVGSSSDYFNKSSSCVTSDEYSTSDVQELLLNSFGKTFNVSLGDIRASKYFTNAMIKIQDVYDEAYGSNYYVSDVMDLTEADFNKSIINDNDTDCINGVNELIDNSYLIEYRDYNSFYDYTFVDGADVEILADVRSDDGSIISQINYTNDLIEFYCLNDPRNPLSVNALVNHLHAYEGDTEISLVRDTESEVGMVVYNGSGSIRKSYLMYKCTSSSGNVLSVKITVDTRYKPEIVSTNKSLVDDTKDDNVFYVNSNARFPYSVDEILSCIKAFDSNGKNIDFNVVTDKNKVFNGSYKKYFDDNLIYSDKSDYGTYYLIIGIGENNIEKEVLITINMYNPEYSAYWNDDVVHLIDSDKLTYSQIDSIIKKECGKNDYKIRCYVFEDEEENWLSEDSVITLGTDVCNIIYEENYQVRTYAVRNKKYSKADFTAPEFSIVNKEVIDNDDIFYLLCENYNVSNVSFEYYYTTNTEYKVIDNESINLKQLDKICVAFKSDEITDTEYTICVIKYVYDKDKADEEKKNAWYDWFINLLNKIIDWFKKLFGGSSSGTTGTTTTTTTTKKGE